MPSLDLAADDLEIVQAMEAELRKRVLPSNIGARLQALLFWVIYRGSMAQLREVLAAGADPNFLYNDGNTSLGLVLHWRSEKDGAEEFFRELIRAGADPNRGLGNHSLMSVACKHGNKEWAIVPLLESTPSRKMPRADLNRALLTAAASNLSLTRRLLAEGASINHRDTVNSFITAAVSALAVASFHGKPDIVQLLLDAGADVNLKDSEGHTALDYALTDPKGCRKAIPLLERAGGVSALPFPREEDPFRDFAAAAKKPAYKQAVARIEELTGIKPAPLRSAERKIPGGKGFLFERDLGQLLVEGRVAEFAEHARTVQEFVERHHDEMLAQGFYLFYGRDLVPKSGDVVALLPTNDVYRVIAALETNGSGSTEDLIAWLRGLEKDQPFSITGVGFDFLDGEFTTPIQDAAALVKRINEICPSDSSTPAEIAAEVDHLRQTNRLYLWWD